jgi:ribosomal protein L10
MCAAKLRKVNMAHDIMKSRVVLVANIRANNTKTTNAMRKELAKGNGSLKFIKNSLVNVAVQEYSHRSLMGNLLHGQVCLIYSDADDAIQTIKVFSTKNSMLFFVICSHIVSKLLSYAFISDRKAVRRQS